MNNQITAEQKRKFELAVKWGLGVALVLAFGSIAVAVLTSIAAIVASAVAGLAAVNALPVLSVKLANWRYRQLRNAVIENPMPTLIKAYDDAVERFKTKRRGVVTFSTTVKNFKDKIDSFKDRNADTSSMEAMYANMKRALAFQVMRLEEQQQNLAEAKVALAETQDKYNMALAMHEANNQLEDFTGETGMDFTMQREAFQAISTKLNEGFARMEISMALDYNALPASVAEREVLSLNVLDSKLKETEFA